MNEPFQLVTNCTFKGKDYLVQMCVLNLKKLELIVTDKLMAEDWQCEYDASYIEALTHKTGNFKQFDVFIVMLKSGLLKTSESITLDLLTWEDLEELRNKKIINAYASSRSNQNPQSNKRYLILTYSVEFDRIHYPLPLEYCGPPNPSVLQSNIRRLEAEVERLKQKNITLSKCDEDENKRLKEKIKFLTQDNDFLTCEVQRLNKLISTKGNPVKNLRSLKISLKKLEDRVAYENKNNYQLITKLKGENKQLSNEVEDLKKREKLLKMQLREATRCIPQKSCRRSSQFYQRPEKFAERRSGFAVEHSESSLCNAVSQYDNPESIRSNKLKNVKKEKNKFLSSSSSESEVNKSNKRRPEVLQSPLPRRSLCSRAIIKSRSVSRESSNKSDGKKKKLPVRHSSRKLTEPKEKVNSFRSRESSLSSRCSSKQSKLSRFSNRGAGDHKSKEKVLIFGAGDNNQEDLKFSVSDLETRIHALQRLLSEGLKF